jgi:hypothetical protein
LGGKGSLGNNKNGDFLGKTDGFMWDNINNIWVSYGILTSELVWWSNIGNIYGFHMELLLRNWFGEVTLVIYMGFIWNCYFGTGLVK